MEIIETIHEMNSFSLNVKKRGKTIGYIPTMGALHEGHTSLVKTAKSENNLSVTSIFVNPIQFGPNEDFSRYPRTFDEDCARLKTEKNDVLFFPKAMEMYPSGFETSVELKNLPDHLCGLSRPGHFSGVATVVLKLFNIILPDIAYFGQKDYQQSLIIRKMTSDLNLPVLIHVMPIVREGDGLAKSSRNRYLTPDERQKAPILFQSLKQAEFKFSRGETRPEKLLEDIRTMIAANAPESRIDYIKLIDPNTLADRQAAMKGDIIALAVYFGKTRLIDNMVL